MIFGWKANGEYTRLATQPADPQCDLVTARCRLRLKHVIRDLVRSECWT